MNTTAVPQIAVLGTGSIGMRHLNALRALGLSEPLAIPVRPKRVLELRDAGFQTCNGIAAATATGATALIVATDTARHVADSLTALRSGMNVLVEKPLAVDAVEAAKLREAAQASGRKVYVGCVLRFAESLQHFRDCLPRVGRQHSISIECRSYLPDWRPGRDYRESYSARKNEGGVLRDLIHEIDYAGWLFGWPAALNARLENSGSLQIEAEEIAELSWKTADGALLSMTLDYLSRPPRRVMRAFGENGTLEWDGLVQQVKWFDADPNLNEKKSFTQTRDGMFQAQARAFLEACNGDAKKYSPVDLEDGIRAISICDAAREASASCCKTVVSYR